MKNQPFNLLQTKYQVQLEKVQTPYLEYPRPSLKRQSYINLNGEWDFKIISKKGQIKFDGKILVPFVPESVVSGVHKSIDKGDQLIYVREFALPEDFIKDKLILHFGAVDQIATVFVNDQKAFYHVGITPFSIDITSYAKQGVNTLKVVAKDDLDLNIPYGKQKAKRGGMWYTKISGIWQTVWLESLPEHHIESIKITPDLKGVTIEVFGGEQTKTVIFQDKEYSFSDNKIRIDVENPVLWSPSNPHLYPITIKSGQDEVQSYFGLRTIEIKAINGKKVMVLNGKPYFFNGVLDQGYFSDGIYLPATEQGYIDDILAMKELGFNTIRKHIKFEPELFYYYCDKLGMIVFQDMINSGKYSFLIDTALPTAFLKRGITHPAGKQRKEQFIKTSECIIDRLYNHPSVVYYTIFNEGWGQFDAKGNYKHLKSLDKTRVFDTTSGWFKSNHSDVESDHVYFRKIKAKNYKLKPWVLSEFGGYSFKIDNHSFNPNNNYGYKNFHTQESFEKAILDLYENQILPCAIKGLNSSIITQLSDVEDETNGFLTYDRKVLKINAQRLNELSQKIQNVFQKTFD